MNKLKKILLTFFVLLIGVFFITYKISNKLFIIYPFNKTLFPPEFPSPTFLWGSKADYHGNWEIKLYSENRLFSLDTVLGENRWAPN
jgi:hypothetical protein